MNRRSLLTLLVLCSSPLGAGGCQPSTTEGGQAHAAIIGDATSMTQNADGTFTVTCKNGTTEIDSAAQIQANQVCVATTHSPSDPFDPASCGGPQLTQADALGYVSPPGNEDAVVGRYQIYRRWRANYPGWPQGAWSSTGGSDLCGAAGPGNCADSGTPNVPLSGDVHIDLDSNKPLIALIGDRANTTPYGMSFLADDWDFSSSSPPTLLEMQGASASRWSVSYAGRSVTFNAAVANRHCVRLTGAFTENETDADHNAWVRESELVILGDIK
jgi:hypothetical protein